MKKYIKTLITIGSLSVLLIIFIYLWIQWNGKTNSDAIALLKNNGILALIIAIFVSLVLYTLNKIGFRIRR